MSNEIIGTVEERLKTVAETDANNRLEGIEPAEKGTLEKELRDKWVAGEISSKERKQILLESFGLD